MYKTSGQKTGTLKIKPTIGNINTLIETSEQAEKDPAIAKAEVRMAVRIAKMLDISVTYTTPFEPHELQIPEQ